VTHINLDSLDLTPIRDAAKSLVETLRDYETNPSVILLSHAQFQTDWLIARMDEIGIGSECGVRVMQSGGETLLGVLLLLETLEHAAAIESQPGQLRAGLETAVRRLAIAVRSDPYAELRQWAAASLKGIERRVVEIVIGNGGTTPLADLAAESTIRWESPYDNVYGKVQGGINGKLKSAAMPWQLTRQNNAAVLSAQSRPKKA